ncbi:protein kinase PINOID-like [Nymphaea colorata]|nr:protein kinase PINOID-like [Nymphaea colorata]
MLFAFGDSDSDIMRNSSFKSFSSDSYSSFSPIDSDLAFSHRVISRQRPRDSSWEAIRKVEKGKGASVGVDDFRVLRKVGEGDMGNVFLCCLREAEEEEEGGGGRRYYAMKVVDKEVVVRRGKVGRAEVERKVLRMVDHPFLPTLYAEFEASHFAFLVMEFCSGGDLHTLRHRQRGAKFPLSSARFYAAEVLLALEYLHMLGIIYRDLKPENILIRSDGHIMLSDFDLCLIGASNPLIQSLPDDTSASLPCFPLMCISSSKRNRLKAGVFTAEPAGTRSHSFVGTHEYVSPEVAAGEPHGSTVDWWAFGIFLYEMIYGFTPFAGANKRETLKNIVQKPLKFPEADVCSGEYPAECAARSLISSLLVKDPRQRMGSRGGSAELKCHPFFKGMNFAKIRSSKPPEVPGCRKTEKMAENKRKNTYKNKKMSRVDYY